MILDIVLCKKAKAPHDFGTVDFDKSDDARHFPKCLYFKYYDYKFIVITE